jgi:pilus assembly protein FimV
LIAKSHRWKKTAIAAAAIALMGFSATGALALSLGRLTVQSALGEPLRAEIDVPDINAEEAASLKTVVASPDAFVAAGLDYNPAMSIVQASLQRRPDGRAFIRITSERAINEPFVDMILETTWSSGRIVRDYTMLFDPPALRQPSTAPSLPQVSAQPLPSVAAKPTPKTASANTGAAASVLAKATEAAPQDGSKRIAVKSGDTASKIAGSNKAASVSLDQMLVALLRANPEAFVNSNINRIRAGAIISVPSDEQAQSVSPAEASQIVVAQSKDFNEFRRNLAGSAPTVAMDTADRKASGAIDAKVEDKKASAPTPDKLTLSKGALQSKANEETIAKERADKETQARAAEIAKNINDLKKLGVASAPPAAAPSTTPVQPAIAPALPVATPPAAAASAPPAPAVATSAPKKVPAPQVVVPPEPPDLVDELLENPMIPAAAGGLIALLGGFAFYRIRQRKKNAGQVDSSFLESKLQPDSFFGASGGQRVDTNNDSSVSGSSMVYSPSQLDAADDVDPVAEADVYLAYGRDLQAEEILKEAVRTTPGRLAIHTKLLEIFAKRRDAKSFEASAIQAFKLTGSDSADWARICEMGLGIDPGNPMYQPGGVPSNIIPLAGIAAGASTFGSTVALSANAELPAIDGGVDLDLDLDFSLDDEPASAISDVTSSSVAAHDQTVQMNVADTDNSIEMDFDVSEPIPLTSSPDSEPTGLPEISLSMDGVSLTESDASQSLSFDLTSTMPFTALDAAPAEAPVASSSSGMLEFDLGSLSLDLDMPSAEALTDAPPAEGGDPLETKLALAEEFVSIGDEDGARALIEEVVAEATGDMRAKAQRALANLS